MTEDMIQRAAILWLKGKGSLHIAKLIGVQESVVYNNMQRIRSCIVAPWRVPA